MSKVIKLSYADNNGYVMCVTCGDIKHISNIDCGHFQKRGNMATRYDPMNLAPQCITCNRFNRGEDKKFAYYIDLKYGFGTSDELRQKANSILKHFDFESAIKEWSDKLDILVKNKTIEL